MRILVVDDSRAMRMIVTRTLRQAGYGDADIYEAADGRDALATIREVRPDVVLADWNMPEMTGIELLETLRRGGDRTRFGFVTSETTPEMRERAVAAGAAFFLAKPFDADDFVHVLSGG